MHKKVVHIICRTVFIVLICAAIWFLCAFFGNPISGALAKSTAERHLQENYEGSDFNIVSIGYDLKTGGYYAKVESPASPDSYFTIYTDGIGRFKRDSSYRIADGTNTFMRLDDEYRTLVRTTPPPDHPEMDMYYGELRTAGIYEIFDYTNENGERKHYTLTKDYGLDVSALVLDGKYDIHQLGRDHGCIHVNVYDTEVTVQRAAELLLQVKNHLDQQGIPFHAIDFDLCEPRNADGQLVGNQINLYEFLYTDIYEDGLIERVAEQWAIAQEHHAIQDGVQKEAKLLVPYFIEIPGNVN